MPECKVCGAQVPASETSCPDCGTVMEAGPVPGPVPEEEQVTPDTGPTGPEDVVPTPEPPPPQPPGPPTPAGAARLVLKRGGAVTSENFQLSARVVVGRFDPESGPVDVDLASLPEAAYVSRHHAEIWTDASGQWFIKDLGSRNGTFVRTADQPQFQRIMGEQVISDGDEIALGNARFEFHCG